MFQINLKKRTTFITKSLSLFFTLTLALYNSAANTYEFDSDEYLNMDKIACEAGADKASFYHNYTKIYSQHLSHLKDKPINFLEIGVYKGASIKLWENYFSKADLNFIDIDYSNLQISPTRAKLYQADQSNPSSILQVIDIIGKPDVILDDGGHTMNQQKTSFITLFPYLKSGGLYIIEDLHTSYWKSFGGASRPSHPKANKNSTTEFLKGLIDELNYIGARTCKANHDQDLSSIQHELSIYKTDIYSITFYDSVCIIQKK